MRPLKFIGTVAIAAMAAIAAAVDLKIGGLQL